MAKKKIKTVEDKKPGVGHNSGISGDQLKQYIQRIESLEEEKRSIGTDIKEVFSEAKGNGFDTKAMRKIIAERKLDAADREEQQSVLDVYRELMGMISGNDEEEV